MAFSKLWCTKVVTTALVIVFFFAFTSLSVAAEGNDRPDGRLSLITVTADGKTRTCIANGGNTVAQQLEKLDITLSPLDTVTPSLDTKLKEGDIVKVSRKRIENQTIRGVIPFETEYTYKAEVLAGDETVVTAGKDGYGDRTYEVLLVEGVEQSRTLVKETLELAPITKQVATGWRSPLVSPFDFNWKFDVNGEPVGAEQVHRSQRSSAYSAKAGTLTATGRRAIVGHVAVNPNVIPYGSKLFIQSKDGKYIYGYCIAADTGVALKDGRVNVDIFYGSYLESVEHGIIWVDIFVLDVPDTPESYGVHTEKLTK